MEDEKSGKDIKLRYMRRRTIAGNTEIEEALQSASNDQPKQELSSEENSGAQTSKYAEENLKLRAKIEELRKENQESINAAEYQTEIQGFKKTINTQNNQISELINKIKALETSEKELIDKNKELLRYENSSKQEQEVKKQLKEMSIELDKQRHENAEYKKKISNLTKSSTEASKIGDSLEACLSKEAAKTAKVQDQLNFTIQNINQEKEELHRTFEAFKTITSAFLNNCNTHTNEVLKSFEEVKKTVDM